MHRHSLTVIIFCLFSYDCFVIHKWTEARKQLDDPIIRTVTKSPAYVIRGDKPGHPVEYLADLTSRAVNGDCDAIYALWEYSSMGNSPDIETAEYWLGIALQYNCRQSVFAQFRFERYES